MVKKTFRLKILLVVASQLHLSCSFAYAADVVVDPVLVSRNDMTLTQSDYEASLSAIPKEKRAQMSPSVKQVMIFIENVMVFRALANEARELGMDKNLVTQKEMRLATDKVLGLKRLEAMEASLKKPDFTAAAKEQYEVKKDKFTIPETVGVAHVLIKTGERSDADARKRAEEVRKKALAGNDFTALVEEYSDDPSKTQNKGAFPTVERGKMVKPFEEAAFAMNAPGDISPLVKTQFGYHVIRLIEKRPAQLKPFDEVKESIIRDLESTFVSDARAAYISKIKNDKSIVIHEDAIAEMRK